jgi:AI-2 transport protein TqsA
MGDENRFYRVAVGLIVFFIAMAVLSAARSILFPFILAVFISYVIDPVFAALIKLKVPKPLATALVLLGAFFVFYLLGVVVYASAKTLAAELPRFGQRLIDLAGALEKSFGGMPLKLRIASYLDQVDLGNIGTLALSYMGPFFGLVSKLFLLFLFLTFIVAGRGRATAKLERALPPARSAQLMKALEKINLQVRRYLIIKTVLALISGLIAWLVLAIFRVDFALLFGFLAFLLYYIPNIGSTAATVLRVSFAFFQFGTLWVPLWILIITGALDLVLGYFVEPRAMGKGLGLSPLLVLFSLAFWGWLWGVPGMIMAVPLTAVIKIVCQNIPVLRHVAVLMEA